MSIPERAFNLLFGLSVLSWAVLGLATADSAARLSTTRLVISALQVCVGVLLLVRLPVGEHGSPLMIVASLPALVVGGWALAVAPPPQAWPLVAQCLFAAGGVGAVVAMLYLGRNFAVLPAVRGTVVAGPYRLVRHPAYAGELTMILACCLAGPSVRSSLPFLVAVPLVVVRILAEERLLRRQPAYADYAKIVRRRLIPLLW